MSPVRRPVLDWDDIQSFREIARRGQIGPAARALGVTDPTLRHRLSALDLRLGEPLFERADGRLEPTDTAAALLTFADHMADAVSLLSTPSTLAGRTIGGEVKISATESIGLAVLTPLLIDLQRRHPRLTLKLGLEMRNEDLLRGETDIAVRLSPPTQKALVARAIMAGRHGLFAHRRYVEAHGAPSRIADLGRFALVGSTRATPTPALFQAMGYPVRVSQFVIRIESQAGQLNAVRAGAGIGVALVTTAQSDPDLVHILPEADLPRPGWLCMHEDLRHAPHIRLVYDAIAAALERPAEAMAS